MSDNIECSYSLNICQVRRSRKEKRRKKGKGVKNHGIKSSPILVAMLITRVETFSISKVFEVNDKVDSVVTWQAEYRASA